ncbi:MAG: hypothetical protein V8R55_11865 [Dysosmobacter sp.]
MSNAVAVDSDMYDAYSDLRDYLRTTKIIYGRSTTGTSPTTATSASGSSGG